MRGGAGFAHRAKQIPIPFREDESRLFDRHAAENFTVLRYIALGLLGSEFNGRRPLSKTPYSHFLSKFRRKCELVVRMASQFRVK